MAGLDFGLEIEGGRELRAALRKAGAEMADLSAVNRRVASLVAARAREIAPRRSGKLADSIRPNAAQRYARVAAGNNRKTASGVPYAGPIHWGWPRNSPKLKNIAGRFRTFTVTADPAWFIRPNTFVVDAAQQTEPVWSLLYRLELERIIETVGESSTGNGP